MRELVHRLRKLEQRIPKPPKPEQSPFFRLGVVLIAHHLGGIQRHESIAEAYARALDFVTGGGLRQAWQSDLPLAQRQHSEALGRLLAARGCDPDSPDDDTFWTAMQGLIDEVPQDLLDRMGIGAIDATSVSRLV
jgi:hypothetical protein